jgi:hypothetical protein
VSEELDAYWRGDFTLGQEPGKGSGREADAEPDGEPDEHADTEERTAPPPVERLAAPDITIRGRNLAALLAPVYRALGP